MNALELFYDELPEMDLSLAKVYLRLNEGIFNCNSWINSEMGELQENIALVFQKTIDGLKVNTDLIIQIEYIKRGVLPVKTAKEIETMLEYFQYYHDILPLIEGDEVFTVLKEVNFVKTVSLDEDSALGSLALYIPVIMLFGLPLIMNTSSCNFPLMHLLKDILLCAGYPVYGLEVVKDSVCEHKFNNFVTTMVIIEGSDLDSAVDTAISAAWNVLSPWALKHISVQESVYNLFLAKLKERIQKVQGILPSNYELNGYILKAKYELEKIKSTVDEEGIECLEIGRRFCSEYFKPLILLDDSNWFAEYLEKRAIVKNIPVICLQAFRTTKEALSLLKKTSSQAASLWCDSNSTCNEFVLSAPASLIWINGYGYKSPNVDFELKCDYDKCISNYTGIAMRNVFDPIAYKSANVEVAKFIYQNCVEKIVKLRQAWINRSDVEKAKIFLNLTSDPEIDVLLNKDADSMRKCLKRAARLCCEVKNKTSVVGQHVCSNLFSPVGIIVVKLSTTDEIIDRINVVLTAIAYGNGIVTCHKSDRRFEKIIDWLRGENIPINYHLVDDDISKFYKLDVVNRVINLTSKLYLMKHNEISKPMFNDCKTVWNTFGETFSA